MVITFAFTGGLLHLPVAENETKPDRRLALLVLSFLAGFSERWAQDTLVAAVPGNRQAAGAARRSGSGADATTAAGAARRRPHPSSAHSTCWITQKSLASDELVM